MCVQVPVGSREETLDPLELEAQAVVSCLVGLLRAEPGSFGKGRKCS